MAGFINFIKQKKILFSSISVLLLIIFLAYSMLQKPETSVKGIVIKNDVKISLTPTTIPTSTKKSNISLLIPSPTVTPTPKNSVDSQNNEPSNNATTNNDSSSEEDTPTPTQPTPTEAIEELPTVTPTPTPGIVIIQSNSPIVNPSSQPTPTQDPGGNSVWVNTSSQ